MFLREREEREKKFPQKNKRSLFQLSRLCSLPLSLLCDIIKKNICFFNLLPVSFHPFFLLGTKKNAKKKRERERERAHCTFWSHKKNFVLSKSLKKKLSANGDTKNTPSNSQEKKKQKQKYIWVIFLPLLRQ